MRIATLLIVLCVVARVALAQEFDAEKLPMIAKSMQQLVTDNQIAGAVTCVVTRDKVIQLDAVGMADVERGLPMKSDSIFWIASMTKPITGASIVSLQEQGKLSIDDPVAKYVPQFADIKTPGGKPANLTIRHLLTHTSGLAEIPQGTGWAKNFEEMIPQFAGKPTQFEPGTQWKYCQTGINTLGRIIEVVSGQSYADFVQEKFFTPLGMNDTTFYPTAEQQKRIAASYKRNAETGKLDKTPIRLFANIDMSKRDHVALANGGLFSTAPDYARFIQMLLNGGTFDGKSYLKPESVKLMTSNLTGDLPKVGFVPPRHSWGCATGIVLESRGITEGLSPGTFGHGGAYGTQAWADPVKGVGYVLMIQRADIGNSDNSDVRMAFQKAAAGAIK